MKKVTAGLLGVGLGLLACTEGSGSAAHAGEGANPAAGSEPRPVETAGPLESVDLVVEGPAGRLAGTLTVPAEGCPCPTAILIPGVGAHDRDYTLWDLPRFRVLAEHLARHGIASLRYDERGVGASTAGPAGATSADYAADVRAWMRALRARARDPDPGRGGRAVGVDPDRVGLIGHSEGGTIAGLAAAGADDVAFVVLLASPGLPGREYNLQYEASLARAAGAGEAEVADRRAFQARALEAVLGAVDSAEAARRLRALYAEAVPDVPPDRLEGGIRRLTSPWFRYSVAHDPAATLRAVDAPVLAVFGERDRQVPPAGNREAVAEAVDVEAGVSRVVVLPGLNHFFQHAETGAPAEYPGLDEVWAPELLELVTRWIRTHAGAEPVRSCTVLHVAGDGYVLGGSNEDWTDPATRFWLIPAEGDRHGWIKFGFAGGFPQGGMNDRGLFWDATGVPYLDMPDSEANKIRYDGPLMEKVITEAGTVAEARAIFDTFYTDDQYRAQYLVGDAGGASMIVEGDTVILGTGGWQVATNFRQSAPELGGYPCVRYEAATAILESAGSVSPFLVGHILEATHQEGAYPTQYSTVYDLERRVVYLLYRHNFDEYVAIDLATGLAHRAGGYDIAPLFSRIRIQAPVDGATVGATSAEIRWEGRLASDYQVCVSTSPDPGDACETVRLDGLLAGTALPRGLLAGTMLLGCLWFVAAPRQRRRHLHVLVFLAAILVAAGSCGADGDPTAPGPDAIGTIRHTATGLDPGTTYYWQVLAEAPGDSGFRSATFTRSFVTGDG